jgi:hypothetical protein
MRYARANPAVVLPCLVGCALFAGALAHRVIAEEGAHPMALVLRSR